MPTVSEILGYAPGASYLAANANGKRVLFNNSARLNPILPQQIYALYFVIKKIYDEDPTYDGLVPATNYLWEIMGRYGIKAQGLQGGGGSIAPPAGTQGYPIYITQADFTTATFYPNTNIFGTNVIIFLNEINRYLIPNTEFTVDATGITITLGGFDASQFDYNLVIEKVYS